MAKNRRSAFARLFADPKSKLESRWESLFDLIDDAESDLQDLVFQGIIIEAQIKPTGRIKAYVRILKTNEYQIPPACDAKSPAQSKLFKSMHVVALSKFTNNNVTNFDENEYIQRKVEVTFEGGPPQQGGRMREATFIMLPKVRSILLNKNAQFCYAKDDGTTTGTLKDNKYNSTLGGKGKSGGPSRRVGEEIWNPTEKPPGPDPWRRVWFDGSHFPFSPLTTSKRVDLNKSRYKYVKEEYMPEMKRVLADQTEGMRLLCAIHAIKEGFRLKHRLTKDKPWLPKGKKPNRVFTSHFSEGGIVYKRGDIIPKGNMWTNRAYRLSNPGNIGNTDSGSNVYYPSLEKGILKQKSYLLRVAEGRHRSYPIGKKKTIKPYWSEEMDNNRGTYSKSPFQPGYKIPKFTCMIQEYVKVYAVSSRSGNSYINMIVGWFHQHGFTSVTPETTIPELLKLDK
jgi:hypothetical protein